MHRQRDALPRSVLFIGSGPLPFTSMLLAERHGLTVTNIDIDEEACDSARTLARRIGLSDKLSFIRADAMSYPDLSEFDCVFLAALVGMNKREKGRLLRHLCASMRPVSRMVGWACARHYAAKVMWRPEWRCDSMRCSNRCV